MGTALAAAGLFWLFRSALVTPIDYDEVSHLHAAWQVTQGLVPYTDFHAVHPPFYWYLIAPAVRYLPESFHSLLLLRWLLIPISVALLGSLVRLAAVPFERGEGALASWLAVITLGLQLPVAETLSEARVDSLSWALLFAGLLPAARDREGIRVNRWALFGIAAGAAFMLNPKTYLFPAAAGVVCLAWNPRSGWKIALRRAAYLAGGVLSSILALLIVLLAAGVDLPMLYKQVFYYHALILKSFAVEGRTGLQIAKAQWASPDLFTVGFFLGAAALFSAARRRAWANARVAAIFALFAVAHLSLSSVGYRQYVAPAYLALSAPLALFLSEAFASRYRNAAKALGALLVLVAAAGEWNRQREVDSSHLVERQIRLGNQLIELSAPGKPVAAQPPRHPIFRTDSTFFWITTITPNDSETETVMARMPEFASRFSYDGYRDQLARRPPSLIMWDPFYSAAEYRRALASFIAERGPREYVRLQVGRFPVFVRRGE